MESKASLRSRMRQMRRNMEPEHHQKLSEEACQRVLASALWQGAKSVLLYAPLGAELNVNPLLDEGWRQGKRVILPKCRENPRGLDFYEVKGRYELKPGVWNIWEPDETLCRVVDAADIDLALIPVVAMDEGGLRLGNGYGYYDRVMDTLSCTVLIGFDEQRVAKLPREPHDRGASWMVTPTGMIQVRDEK